MRQGFPIGPRPSLPLVIGARAVCIAAWAAILIIVAGLPPIALAQDDNDVVANQWFTGSLYAPSPALPKAGLFAVEPYAVYTHNTGAFDGGWGHYSVPNDLNQLESLTLLKYGITDRLSIQAIPTFSHAWNDQATSGGLGANDLPIELEYRLRDQNNRTGSPSITMSLGMNFPTGDYNRLSTRLNGVGSGAYTAKLGVLLQSLFNTWDDHPMRLRFFGVIYSPLGSVSVRDISVYGTNQGFRGQVAPGVAGQLGIGIEYGLDQRWVLALDLIQTYASGYSLSGTDASGTSVSTLGPSRTSIIVAPAIEYNWSSSLGIIVGVGIVPAGRNTASHVAPQMALNISF
jgi:hypothetical protein